MATAKKGVVATVKDGIGGLFSDAPARKSPKRVAAGKKAAVTKKTNAAVKTAKTAVKKAVQVVSGKTPAARRAR